MTGKDDSDATFPVALGGRQWDLPHLPFRVIKKIQPTLFAVYVAAGAANMSSDTIAKLSESDLDRFAEAAWRAIAYVDKDLTLEAFLDLPFSVAALVGAFPAIAYAAGLRPAKTATAEASPGEGKQTSTA